MKLRTEIQIEKPDWQFEHQDKLLFMGSCFSENIGQKCSYHKIDTVINPFGITFNPLSIIEQLELLIQGDCPDETLHHNELHHSWIHHSSFSDVEKNVFSQQVKESFDQGKQQLATADILVLTFGSAYYYRHIEKEQVVNNCHKYPSDTFTKELCQLDEIIQLYTFTISKLRVYNPSLKIILTVSPVRHIKDGLTENQRSKSLLSLLSFELSKLDNVDYFPAYEIMMDELRDYRFYNQDMIHPNELAVDYIWEKFQKTFISDEGRDLIQQISKLQKSIHHRSLHETTNAHQRFLENLKTRVRNLEEKHPYISFK